MAMISTAERASIHTAPEINRQIRQSAEERIAYFSDHRDEISARLRELDYEWDVERAMEANAAMLAFAGVVLGATRHRGWLMLPAAVTAFLFQHAVQGWRPAVSALRRLGFRTADEINQERFALKALRGDFQSVQPGHDLVGAALRAVGLRQGCAET